jgi:hypothetical protein
MAAEANRRSPIARLAEPRWLRGDRVGGGHFALSGTPHLDTGLGGWDLVLGKPAPVTAIRGTGW